MRLTIDYIPNAANMVSLTRYNLGLQCLLTGEGKVFPPDTGKIEADGEVIGEYKFTAGPQLETERVNVHGVLRQLISIRASLTHCIENGKFAMYRLKTLEQVLLEDYPTPRFTTEELDKPSAIMAAGDDDEFRGINSSGDRVVDYPDPPKMADDLKADLHKQMLVFNCVERLCEKYNALPPVVDDDYPEARHKFNATLRDLIDALDENGNLEHVKKAAIRKSVKTFGKGK